jgi:hypothetical protein
MQTYFNYINYLQACPYVHPLPLQASIPRGEKKKKREQHRPLTHERTARQFPVLWAFVAIFTPHLPHLLLQRPTSSNRSSPLHARLPHPLSITFANPAKFTANFRSPHYASIRASATPTLTAVAKIEGASRGEAAEEEIKAWLGGSPDLGRGGSRNQRPRICPDLNPRGEEASAVHGPFYDGEEQWWRR